MRMRRLSAALAFTLLTPAAVAAADGDLDPTFGDAGLAFVATVVLDHAAAIAPSADGKVVTLARGVDATGSVLVIARFDASGALDTTFDKNGRRTVSVPFGGEVVNLPGGLLVDAGNRIVVAGSAITSGGASAGLLVRLWANGELDETFGDGGVVVYAPVGENRRFSGVARRPNGNLVVSGVLYDPLGDRPSVFEFDPLGELVDSTDIDLFAGGASSDPDLLLEPDGSIVIAAVSNSTDEVALARLTPGLDPDSTFDGDGQRIYPQTIDPTVAKIDRTEEGRYVLGVGFAGSTSLFWLEPDGEPDPGACSLLPFCIYLGFDLLRDLVVQSDGKALAIGSTAGAEKDARVGRFLASGAADPSFGVNGQRAFDCLPGAGTSHDLGIGLALSAGRPEAVAQRSGVAATDAVCVARLTSDLIFAHGFEGGEASGWR